MKHLVFYYSSKKVCLCVCEWQVEGGVAQLAEDCLSGRWFDLQAVLSRVLQQHSSQFQLLLEVQGLRSR